MTITIGPLCEKCGESISGHMQPFETAQRTCIEARTYRQCKDPHFCRRPEYCSLFKGRKCHTEEKYGRSCDD